MLVRSDNPQREPATRLPSADGAQEAIASGCGKTATAPAPAVRRSIFVRGIVQGVGFRPYVFSLAAEIGVGGFVCNSADGVVIEVEGDAARVAAFEERLPAGAPPRARIARIDGATVSARGEREFVITGSERGDRAGERCFPADVATCSDCLAELFDPADRRYRYPFINCAHCGPRFTILRCAPYDRPNTTMAGFAMCGACRREYDDPAARRFHAQPVACPACGPRLIACDAEGRSVAAEPFLWARSMAEAGRILAVKGVGGFHLACDARSEAATQRLRVRKNRDDKPFAMMVADLDAARRLCHVSQQEAALLSSSRRPIVLLRRRPGAGIAAAVAPGGNPMLGVMLPCTPLHELLVESAASPLVLTSGNRCDEPIAFDDLDALQRLREIADGFLLHDRPIQIRCDDSVARVNRDRPVLLRRSRGYAPEPLATALACPQPILALGGHLKNTFALAAGRSVFLSHHLGDLGDWAAYRAFREAVAHYETLFDIHPQVLVHDLHPDYATTRYALERNAHDPGLRLVAVQHHHAHMASCMAENGLAGPVIAVTFDGVGLGSDGTMWGGEFLVGDYRTFRRAAHLRPVPLAGGERAIRQPWRVALAHLLDAGLDPGRHLPEVPGDLLHMVGAMIRTRAHSPDTTSAGRLFDAAAALLGVRRDVSYEGQAAIELEWLATTADAEEAFPFVLERRADALVVDTRPLIQAMMRGVSASLPQAQLARSFHATVADIVACVVARLRSETGIEDVALTGGVFQNALLFDMTVRRLERSGLRVHAHGRVPAGDGGLALGQLAVAAAVLQEAR
ncbi:MAG TPA: carbamoyltransferase HypF [Candidatus Limnocylindrales bacterium]|nr:carbamoyltransferase HypF [Candidatus Limnocylindrales bacterium]